MAMLSQFGAAVMFFLLKGKTNVNSKFGQQVLVANGLE